MHRSGFSALAAAVALTLMASPARADSKKTFTALLNAGQETPPTTSDAFGVAFLTFDAKTKTLCYAISFSRLSSTEIAAHIHGPAAPGVAANIVFSLTPVPGNPKNSCVGPFTGAVKKALMKGQLYLNVNTNDNPNGEIRGQIIRTGS